MTQRLIDTPTLAEYLGISQRQVRSLVYRREIPFTKVGRAVRFDLRKIDKWIEENSTPPRR